ncbi:MAG: hypothetical protein SFU25_09325 [Candidatus Caenarcaniphilales bacterium]|nr:hypothetical protein [Candidatus Caenarcaniphilales bacterium]
MILTLGLISESAFPDDLDNEATILTKHRFSIFFDKNESKLEHELSSVELINAIRESTEPDLIIKGKLILESLNSVPLCRVRLNSELIEAKNKNGDKVQIHIKGLIGSRRLSMEFVNPDFGETNVANFVIYGFVVPSSLKAPLKPGQYEYQDEIKLVVEF